MEYSIKIQEVILNYSQRHPELTGQKRYIASVKKKSWFAIRKYVKHNELGSLLLASSGSSYPNNIFETKELAETAALELVKVAEMRKNRKSTETAHKI